MRQVTTIKIMAHHKNETSSSKCHEKRCAVGCASAKEEVALTLEQTILKGNLLNAWSCGKTIT